MIDNLTTHIFITQFKIYAQKNEHLAILFKSRYIKITARPLTLAPKLSF